MPQADFDFIPYSTDAFVDGSDGTALLHSSLANPLPGEGTYCRLWRSSTGSGRLKVLANDPALVGLSNTKAVSLRSWMRCGGGSTSLATGLIARTTSGNTDNGSTIWEGYSLRWRNNAFGDIFLGLYAKAVGSGTGGATLVAGELFFDNFANVWAKLRLDVIPLLDGNDILEAYTGTGATGSETWTKRLSAVVSSRDAYYCPATVSSRVGLWLNTSSSGTSNNIFDRFEVFTEDV